MRCKEASGYVDLGVDPKNWGLRIRIWLHLLHCRACTAYVRESEYLRRAVKSWVFEKENVMFLPELNQNLLKKFSQNFRD